MKSRSYLRLFIFLSFIGFVFGQTQLGSDIDGAIKGYEFGSIVSLSSDGSRIAIGAHGYS